MSTAGTDPQLSHRPLCPACMSPDGRCGQVIDVRGWYGRGLYQGPYTDPGGRCWYCGAVPVFVVTVWAAPPHDLARLH